MFRNILVLNFAHLAVIEAEPALVYFAKAFIVSLLIVSLVSDE